RAWKGSAGKGSRVKGIGGQGIGGEGSAPDEGDVPVVRAKAQPLIQPYRGGVLLLHLQHRLGRAELGRPAGEGPTDPAREAPPARSRHHLDKPEVERPF